MKGRRQYACQRVFSNVQLWMAWWLWRFSAVLFRFYRRSCITRRSVGPIRRSYLVQFIIIIAGSSGYHTYTYAHYLNDCIDSNSFPNWNVHKLINRTFKQRWTIWLEFPDCDAICITINGDSLLSKFWTHFDSVNERNNTTHKLILGDKKQQNFVSRISLQNVHFTQR